MAGDGRLRPRLRLRLGRAHWHAKWLGRKTVLPARATNTAQRQPPATTCARRAHFRRPSGLASERASERPKQSLACKTSPTLNGRLTCSGRAVMQVSRPAEATAATHASVASQTATACSTERACSLRARKGNSTDRTAADQIGPMLLLLLRGFSWPQSAAGGAGGLSSPADARGV